MNILNNAGKCINKDLPACSGTCPFHIDIRTVTGYIRDGKWKRAMKEYRKAVLFPAIVSGICDAPCEKACFRSETDESVRIRALERALVLMSGSSKGTSRYISAKNKQVLVVGAGLSGLAASVRLADRGYSVHLAEAGSIPGGSLWNKYPELDQNIALTEITLALDHKYIHTTYNTKISEEQFTDYDAVVIASGSTGRTWNTHEGIFLTGEAEDPKRTLTDALAAGMAVTAKVDAWLRNTNPLPDTEIKCRYMPDTSKWQPAVPVLAADGSGSEETVIREAERCMRCTCTECVDNCHILKHYYQDPVKAMEDINGALNKTEFNLKKAQPFINSCTLCGKCRARCPQNIDFGEMSLYARQTLRRKNDFPPVYHEYWINEALYSSGTVALVRTDKDRDTAEWAFFPGCQLGGSDPEYIVRIYDFLRSELSGNGAIFSSCCGVPLHWSGKEDLFREAIIKLRQQHADLGLPVVILTCPTCREVFDQYLPEIKTKMIWEAMNDAVKKGNLTVQEEPMKVDQAVFDPCVSARMPGFSLGVRDLLSNSGITAEELRCTDESSACCGYGGLVYLANQDLYKETVSSASSLSDKTYLTWCINCRDSFAMQGKHANYLADLYFFDYDRSERVPPTPSERRRNRLEVKRRLLEVFWNESETEHHDLSAPFIEFTTEAKNEIQMQLLLEEDIADMVRSCTEDKEIILTDSGMTCYKKIGTITCHADFISNDRHGYLVTRVYSHRVTYLPRTSSERGEELKGLTCLRCGKHLTMQTADFEYLGQRLQHQLPVCPDCRQIYLSEEICRTKLHQVELLLEEK